MKSLATSLVLYLSLLLNDLSGAHALKLHGRQLSPEERLQRRTSMSAQGDLKNDGDLKYFTNISLNDVNFPVLIDTGSSDLYVTGNVPGAGNTGKKGSVNYAIGAASGPILTAKLEFEEHIVMDQAFILDTSGNNVKGEGLLGLGPNSGSNIHQVLKNSNGDTPLDRIFRQNHSTPNYISIYLGRSDDPTDPFPGDLTIGHPISPFENITSMPKLPVFEVSNKYGQHWQTLVDEDGIIGPDGQPIKAYSRVKNGGKSRLNVIFDTGFSLPQVPKSIADAFYARVPGASLVNYTGLGEVYTMPCDVELNVTFKFANVSYPIHPLDTSLSSLGKTDKLGNPVCVGSFQPIQAGALSDTYDMILGMAFLRNAYMLIDFGDFVDGANSSTADPYIQLLPLTDDLAEAHSDFVKIRLQGVDNTGNFQLLPASVLPPVTEPEDNEETLAEKIHPYLPYIIAGSALLGVALLIGIAFCIASSRRKRYRRLHDPAPAGLHQDAPFTRYEPQRRY